MNPLVNKVLAEAATDTAPKVDKTKAAYIQKLLESEAYIRERTEGEIKFDPPLITAKVDNEWVGYIYPNTINMIQGQAGVHKSRLAANICKILLTHMPKEVFGFKRNLIDRPVIVYIDTERGVKSQLPKAVKHLYNSAGYSTMPKDFLCFSFKNIQRGERMHALLAYLDDLRFNRFADRHLFIVLDVITDCLRNFNDVEQSMQLLDYISNMADQQNCTFLCLIHENPGVGEKARGNVGTELMNKSSTAMQIAYDKGSNDLIKMVTKKARESKRLEPLYLVYSKEYEDIVQAEGARVADAKEARQHKGSVSQIRQFIFETVFNEFGYEISRNDLFERIVDKFNISESTIKTRLKAIVEDKEVMEDDLGVNYLLSRQERGKETFYSLARVERVKNTEPEDED